MSYIRISSERIFWRIGREIHRRGWGKHDYDDQYGFIDLYGAREDRCGKDYKKYGKLVQKLAGLNLSKLNSGIESMVDDAIELSKQPWN